MAVLIIFLALLLIVAGIIMMIKPDFILNFIKQYHDSFMLQLFASAFRITIGVVLYLVSSQTRFPLTFEYLGILVIMIGVVIALIPPSKFGNFVKKMIDIFFPYARLAAVVALIFGAWLIYALI